MSKTIAREIDRDIFDKVKQLKIATPALIASEINRNRRYVANRMSYLVKEGLLEKITRGVYRVKD